MSETVEPQGQAGMAASEDPAEGAVEEANDGDTGGSTPDETAVEGFSSQDNAEG